MSGIRVREQGELVPAGEFSLAAAAGFSFEQTEGRAPGFDGAMRLAFPIDGGRDHAGAVIRQAEPNGPVSVELELTAEGSASAALGQVARVLSLDHDGEGFARIGARDPAIGKLQRAHPGQRPVLFHSPYEGAAWAILSARRPAAQSAGVRAALGAELGVSFTLAGETLTAFPKPERLAALREDFPGLNASKVARLRALAAAAVAGKLDVGRLHELGPEGAYQDLQQLPGIGPFYSGLVVLRASGFADALLPMREPKVLAHAARLYGLDSPPSGSPRSPKPGGRFAPGRRC